jgi:hypothetical protein
VAVVVVGPVIHRLGAIAFWAFMLWHLAVIVLWEAAKRRLKRGSRR